MLSYTNHDAITCTHSLFSEINWISYCKILTFGSHPLPSSHAHTNPSITIQMTQVKYFFSLFNHYSSPPSQENTALIPVYYIRLRINIWFKNPSSTSRILWRLHWNHTNNAFPTKKKPRVLCYQMSTVNTPNIQHTCLPPTSHNIISINLLATPLNSSQ